MAKTPSRKSCVKLMSEYGMPQNVIDHSFKVKDVGVFLAKNLNKKGTKIDIKVVEASALLHDIAKVYCKNSPLDHAEVGADILRTMGYDRIADVIEQHIALWAKYKYLNEEEVVNYADKRVMHDKITSLSKRFEDVKQRYASNSLDILERINFTEKESYRLEKRIFKHLDFLPEDLETLVEK